MRHKILMTVHVQTDKSHFHGNTSRIHVPSAVLKRLLIFEEGGGGVS